MDNIVVGGDAAQARDHRRSNHSRAGLAQRASGLDRAAIVERDHERRALGAGTEHVAADAAARQAERQVVHDLLNAAAHRPKLPNM